MRMVHPAQGRRPSLSRKCTAPTTTVWWLDGGHFRCDHARHGALRWAPVQQEELSLDPLDRWFGSVRHALCHMPWTTVEADVASAMLMLRHVFYVGGICPAPRSTSISLSSVYFSDRSGSHLPLTRLAFPIEPAILLLLPFFVARRGWLQIPQTHPRRGRVWMSHPCGGLVDLGDAPHPIVRRNCSVGFVWTWTSRGTWTCLVRLEGKPCAWRTWEARGRCMEGEAGTQG